MQLKFIIPLYFGLQRTNFAKVPLRCQYRFGIHFFRQKRLIEIYFLDTQVLPTYFLDIPSPSIKGRLPRGNAYSDSELKISRDRLPLNVLYRC